jgi:quercetin dioxygenase-like cupin family protein
MVEIERAEVVVPCEDLTATLAFFTEQLGFRLESIRPADDPRAAVVFGYGVRLRLERGAGGSPGTLRLVARETRELVAPNGMRIVFEAADVALPPARPSFVLSRASDARWVVGRAGMRYRDLVPDRQGGRFIASQIRIEDGGEVPDYVHYHGVRFQMIYCAAGWVRLVYEGQGEPFVMHPGDCVLQPPKIRHRVLESSAGLEVIEITSPSDHETFVEHDLALPGGVDRVFDGQRFVRHVATSASWRSLGDLEARDLGIASARVVRGSGRVTCSPHAGEVVFGFVLKGTATLHASGRTPEPLAAGDAYVVPPETAWSLDGCDSLELLDVRA